MSKEFEEVIAKYEEALESVYVEQTRGDYTWLGILMSFFRDISDLEKKPVKPPFNRPPGYRGIEE